MNKYNRILSLCAAALIMVACSDKNTPKLVEITGETISLTAPSNFASMDIRTGNYTFTNVTTGVATTIAYPLSSDSRVMEGLYHVKFEGEADCVVNTKGGEAAPETVNVKMQGVQENVVVKGDGTFKLTLALSIIPGSGDNFVISEIYYTGSAYSPDAAGKQKQYNGDQYVVITNNSDQVLYADGLAFVESEFMTSSKNDYTPNIQNEAITVQALFVIPGSGSNYPVQPGGSITICDNAQNHKALTGETSFMDLGQANFEWYTKSTNNNYPDTDNPAVPNLDIYYCYTATIFVLNKQGNRGYALVKMGADKDTYLANYTYQAHYTNALGKPTPERTYYKIPNDWVIDAVEVSNPDKHQWLVYTPSMDISYTYCGEKGSSTTSFGKSVKRKVASTTTDGRKILQDTNNSAEDFERNATPSKQ